MHRTGLAPYGQDDDAVRWAAVRHAGDHIHIVAMLARQDGRPVNLWHDYYRVREACQAAERRYGLRATAPADRTAAPRPTRAENVNAGRLLSALGTLTHDPATTAITLVIRLAALAETVAVLRHAQRHAAQAAAARIASQRLRAAAGPQTQPPPRGPGHPRPRTAADAASLDFPFPPTAGVPAPGQDTPAPGRPAAYPRPAHPSPTRRGRSR